MQAYIDKTYYIDNYLKGREPVIIAGSLFYTRSASQVIDRYTLNRLKSASDVPEEVQMCCYELPESEYHREKQQKESGGKTSEKIGIHLAGFTSTQEFTTTISRGQRSIVMKWLAHTGLCYQKV